MQKRSLLSEYQMKIAAEMAAGEASEKPLANVATGNSGTNIPIGGGPFLQMPCGSESSVSFYLFFYYEIGGGVGAVREALPNVRKGDLVLKAGSKYTILPSPVTMWLCSAYHYWAERVSSSQQLVSVRQETQDRESRLKEEIEALVLVLSDDGLAPATWRTKGAACRGPREALQELARAGTPEWLAQSEAHKVTDKLPMPWTRFVVEIDYHLEMSRNGNEYVVTGALCRPINPETFTQLRDYLTDPKNQLQLGQVYDEHRRRLNEVKQRLVV